jgi:hypothetical protein
LKDIELTPDQLNELKSRMSRHQWKGSRAISDVARKRRAIYQEEGKNQAKLCEKDHLVGCMLYWGEGRKDKNTMAFSNTDENAILAFKKFIDKYFFPKPEEYRLYFNCYLSNGISSREIENYWLNLLELPSKCLRKSCWKEKPDSTAKRCTHHEYGVCQLVLGNTRIVQHIYGAIQEYLGFENPSWLG